MIIVGLPIGIALIVTIAGLLAFDKVGPALVLAFMFSISFVLYVLTETGAV